MKRYLFLECSLNNIFKLRNFLVNNIVGKLNLSDEFTPPEKQSKFHDFLFENIIFNFIMFLDDVADMLYDYESSL